MPDDLSPCELHWVAGFLEGEGSFGFHPGDGTLWINAAQKEAEPLERVRAALGGQIYAPGKQPIHRWALYGQAEIERAMRSLYPLLSTRRQGQIDKALRGRAAYPGSETQLKRNAERAAARREKYATDEEFRERQLARQREWAKRNRDYKREWRKRRKKAGLPPS